ncbi:hypothetical protein [Psychrobacillus sp. BL-248-WT-3]|uniref:hypothetical protein n=1 Tax=Psychrobacillus sp. BL-248-WT-3 TaxID=2725306 RepID=UPI00146C40BF|nr:hypothetical protein [Psychrobacillus sp. BL-248-WT-3]NME05778.1 hypothetical protein [Psychrobacillus sp. BL-248-WT-3]
MNNKTKKIAVATAVAASAIVSIAPHQADAASNIDQLMTNVQNSSTVLKWAISIEGSADGVTQPWSQFNEAKAAIANAEKEIKKLSFSEQLKYDLRLTEAKTQLKRAQGYLDAITASTKINDKTIALSAAVSANNLDLVEKTYHEMTAEFRKQTILLDRVYGQSTRDRIRNVVKGPAEKLINELKNDVTVHMKTKGAAEDIRLSRQAEAARKIYEAQAILDANALKWESRLQSSLTSVTNALPIEISSISRIDNTTLNLKLNRAISSVQISEFTVDNSLLITNATLSRDGLTVTLTTSAQTPSVKYSVKYKGSTASFIAPGTIIPIQMGNSTVQHRDTSEVLALTGTFSGYGYSSVKIDIPAGLKVLSINGIENNITGSKSVNVLPDKNGTINITFTASNVNTPALDKVITFNRLENNRVADTQTSPTLNFYAPAKTGTISNKAVRYIDNTNNYFVTSDGFKYILKGYSDTYKNEDVAVSLDTFKAALNIEDIVNGNYQTNSSSSFNISVNHYSVPLLLDSQFGYKNAYGYRMLGNQLEFSGTGQPNYEVFFFKNTGALLGKVRIGSNGTWKYKTSIEQNAINDFYIVQQPAGKLTPAYNSGTSFRVIEGPFNIQSVGDGKTPDEDITNEELEFTIAPISRANTIVFRDNAIISNSAYITLKDEDGTTVQYTNNKNSNLFSKTTNGFKVKFGPNEDDKLSGEVIAVGKTPGLSGPLEVIAVEGINNAYNNINIIPKLLITKY